MKLSERGILTMELKSFTNIFHDIKFDTKHLGNLQELKGLINYMMNVYRSTKQKSWTWWYWEHDYKKKVATEIPKPLSTIFNCSLKTGVVPEQLKIAKTIPIYKKEDVEIFSNYRPVSVLPCFSKILERLMFNRCIDYIDKNSILNEKQFRFRTNHST